MSATGRGSAFPRRDLRPSDACSCRSLETEGAGNAGCTPHPLPCVHNKKRRTQANTGTPKTLRHSLRNGFTAYSALSLVSGLLSHHRCANRFPQLDPSIGGSGPHGLTVRAAPHVLRRYASIATRLTSGDEWPSRPSCRGGMARIIRPFRISERTIFL